MKSFQLSYQENYKRNMNKYIKSQQKKIIKALHRYLNKNHIKQIYIYVANATNEFLNESVNSLLYLQQYKDTTIINPAFYYKGDYRKNINFDKITNLIIVDQKQSDVNDIKYHIGTFIDKPTFFITFNTIISYGIYESEYQDMFFDSLL